MKRQQLAGISNVRIVDPRTGSVSEPRTLEFTEDRIARISEPNTEVGKEFYDGGGAYAVPGLIDCHVHVTAHSADLGSLENESPSYLAAFAIRTMQDSLRRGFTTLRDAGGADFGLAQARQSGLFVGPRLFFGGKSLSQTGGHADMRARGRTALDSHQCCPNLGIVCDGETEVRRAARNQFRTGADHLKLMLSGGVASPTDRIDSTQFSDAEIRAAVEEAAACNRYVLGHAYTAAAINRGLELGVRSIEHGNLLDERSLELFHKHRAFLVPTLVTYERLQAEGRAHGLPPVSLDKVSTVLDAGLEALRKADRAGVQIAFGTDLLGEMWRWQSLEFEIRSRVQEPRAVLESATLTGARLLGQEDHLGQLAEGFIADVVLLDENPLEEIRALSRPERHVRAVVSEGALVV